MFKLSRHGDILHGEKMVGAGNQGDIVVSIATERSNTATTEKVCCGVMKDHTM